LVTSLEQSNIEHFILLSIWLTTVSEQMVAASRTFLLASFLLVSFDAVGLALLLVGLL
jgi:hypothetical protein